MSSKNQTPRKPENKLVNRADVIQFADFLSTHEPWLRKVMAASDFLRAEDRRKRVWWRRLLALIARVRKS